MSSAPEDPLVGWIKSAGGGFDNARDACRVSDFTEIPLDPGRLAYFEAYFREYYYDRFRPSQGTEEILAVLGDCAPPGAWLDLGSATTTLFWSIPLSSAVTSISCCDVVAEALKTLAGFAASQEVPACYREVLKICGKSAGHLRDMRRKVRDYFVFDALAPWPEELFSAPFDLLTAFGLFGIAASAEGYARAFQHAARHLAAGGRAIGADWLRRPSFIAEDGHDNSYLTPALTRRAASRAGLRVLHCRQVPIAGDRYYRALICWALEKARE